jgi:predicted deacylase
VIHFPVLSFSPRLGPRTPEHTRAVEAVAKAQATRFALEQARKRPPVADQFYVARAVLRARDARFVLPSEASEEQSARVDVLERKARQLLERLNKNGVLKATNSSRRIP